MNKQLPGELNRLARRGQPIKESLTGGPVTAPRVRKDTLNLQKQKRTAFTGFKAPLSVRPQTGIHPPKLAAPTEHVDAHTRKVNGKVVQVGAHERRGDEPKKRPVFRASEAGKARAAKTLELWHAWNDATATREKKRAMGALLKDCAGMIEKEVRKHRALIDKVVISEEALRAQYRKAFVAAVKKYDPERGVQFNTFATRQLEAVKRFVTTYRNTARITEPLAYDVGRVQRATEHLRDILGREPSHDEVSEYSGVKLEHVSRLSRELRQGLVASEWEADPTAASPSKKDEVLDLLWRHRDKELTPKEQKLLQVLREAKTDDDIKPRALARRLGFSASEVSRLKLALVEKVLKYQGA